MTIYDIISEFDENKTFTIKDQKGNVLSIYDGKNSIDEHFNFFPIAEYTEDENGNGCAIVDNDDVDNAIADAVEYALMAIDDAPNRSVFVYSIDAHISRYVKRTYRKTLNADKIDTVIWTAFDIIAEMV